ncbi:serine/threonine protein kinase [Polyangium aurulentum]|uniref:serine/threonine protein kinase n=1 Tax=Polyangium aurulentum TaxID=2567896 RepID=UPI0010AE4EC5|nr:serine/threonine-protein kinase [Polyangium aurulentum]UQA55956.1 protein kinase [Polyangium aurulentum]
MSGTSTDIPERLGRYEIIERLAAGGMGEVFVARSVAPGGFVKPVALKRIHPHLASDETFINMLHDEANVASSIHHPNIVGTIDVGSEGDNHYVVLDFVSGDPLTHLLRDVKRKGTVFPGWMAAWIGAQIGAALHAAHEAKNPEGEALEIIHRDVSLSNVLLSDAGQPMLFDFGVAKAKQRMVQTSHGELKGKLPYMAPETFRGEAVDRTVDVFSLGVVLYELLTGKSPFARDSDLETIMALQSAVIVPPSQVKGAGDADLDAVVLKAMCRTRAERYATAADVETALRAWARTSHAPHDASAAAAWIAETFPARCAAHKAVLARVASGTRPPASNPSPRQSFNTIPPGQLPPPSGPVTPAPFGMTPPPSGSVTPVPFGMMPPPSGSVTPVPFGMMPPPSGPVTPVPFGMTPLPPSAVSTGKHPASDVSIPGVASAHLQGAVLEPGEATPARDRASGARVAAVGAAIALTLGIAAFVALRSEPAEEPAAGSSPVAATASPAPVSTPSPVPVAPVAPVATATASSAKASAPQTAVPATSPRTPATTTTRGRGPLVRSYD